MKYAPSFKDHMIRYAFAMPFAWKRDTLDAGSKEGFGAQALSWVAKSITLTDINPVWLQYAQKNGGYVCPASFREVDYETSFPDGEWDTIVAFEIIEHLEKPDVFLQGVKDHLRKGGRLVFSVPHMVANHEHKHLYDEALILELVGKYLTVDEMHTQDATAISGLPLYKKLVCHVGVATKR